MSNLNPRRLGLMLLASLGLNLFLAGFLAARLWGGPGHPPPGRPFGPRELVVAARQAGAEGQVRELMQRRREGLRKHHGQMRAARAEVHAALLAEPFDAARLREALDRVHSGTADAQSAVHEAFVELAQGMTPAQRKALAAQLRRRPRR